MMTPNTHPGNEPLHAAVGGETPTQKLIAEHESILQALAALEGKLDTWEKGTPPDRAYVEKAVEFLRSFADRCHHGKEEDILFKAMVEELDFPRNAGPVAVLTREHEQGRAYLREIGEAAGVLGQDPDALRRVVGNGRQYIQLLRMHIDRENTVVFPMVDQFLAEADNARLARQFDDFEREEMGQGRHEALARLLTDLIGTGSNL